MKESNKRRIQDLRVERRKRLFVKKEDRSSNPKNYFQYSGAYFYAEKELIPDERIKRTGKMITPRCLNCNYPLYENLKFYCFIECSRCVELYMKRGNRLYQVKKLAEITGKEYRTAKGIVEKRDFLDVGGQEVVTST